MSLKQFIENNRPMIDSHIVKKLGTRKPQPSDKERRLWVLNDYDLYLWARSEGVRI